MERLGLRGVAVAERLRRLADIEDDWTRVSGSGNYPDEVSQLLLTRYRSTRLAERSLSRLLHARNGKRRLATHQQYQALAERVSAARSWLAAVLPSGSHYESEEAYQLARPARDVEQRVNSLLRRREARAAHGLPRERSSASRLQPEPLGPELRSLADAICANLPAPNAPSPQCPIRIDGRRVRLMLPDGQFSEPYSHRLTDAQRLYLEAVVRDWPHQPPATEGMGSPKHRRSELREAIPDLAPHLARLKRGRPTTKR